VHTATLTPAPRAMRDAARDAVPSRDVARALALLATGGPPAGVREALARVPELLCTLGWAQRAVLYVREGDEFVGHGAYGDKRLTRDIARCRCGQDSDALTREIIQTREAVVINNARRDGRVPRSAVVAWGIRSVIGLPIVVGDDVLAIAYVDGGDGPQTCDEQDATALIEFARGAGVALYPAAQLEQAGAQNEILAEQHRVLERTLAFSDQVMRTAAQGGTLEQIVTLMSRHTGRPCVVYGEDGALLASASPADGRPVNDLVPATLAGLARVRQALGTVGDERPTVVRPQLGDEMRHGALAMKVPVVAGGHLTLVVLEVGGRLRRLDAHILARVAPAVEISLAAQRHRDRARCDLTRDLLSGRPPVDLRQRARHLGVDLERTFLVCVCTQDRPGAAPGDGWATRLTQQLGAPAVCLTAEIGAYRVAMVDIGDDGVDVSSERQRLHRTLSAALAAEAPDLHAVISDAFHGPDGAAEALAEATDMLSRSLRAGEGPRVLLMQPTVVDLLKETVDGRRRERFVARVLDPLIEDDKPGGGALLETLELFFATSRSVRQTAVLQQVHENTVRYRLARVQRKTGLDVANNADHQLAVQVALLLGRADGNPLEQRTTRADAVATVT
jgi:sugar diacid utilization regulator